MAKIVKILVKLIVFAEKIWLFQIFYFHVTLFGHIWPHLSKFDLIFSLRYHIWQSLSSIWHIRVRVRWALKVYKASNNVNIKTDVAIDTVISFAKHAGNHLIEKNVTCSDHNYDRNVPLWTVPNIISKSSDNISESWKWWSF